MNSPSGTTTDQRSCSSHPQRKRRAALYTTDALGDIIISSALQHALAEQGFATTLVSASPYAELWRGMADTDVAPAPSGTEDLCIDVRMYLRHLPHSHTMPRDGFDNAMAGDFAPLATWMAYEAWQLNKAVSLHPEQRFSRIVLDGAELDQGSAQSSQCRRLRNGKPLVVVCPTSTSPNRNPSGDLFVSLHRILEPYASVVHLLSHEGESHIPPLQTIGPFTPRVGAAFMLHADAVVCCDSGPLHLANAAYNGAMLYEYMPQRAIAPGRICCLAGSSHPRVVCYPGNKWFVSDRSACPVMPCGAHGYADLDVYAAAFGRPFYAARKGGSGCVNASYSGGSLPPCLASLPVGVIAQEIKVLVQAL